MIASKANVGPLVVAAVIAVVVSLAASRLLEAINQIYQELYGRLPQAVGYQHGPPKSWSLPILAVGAPLVALAIPRLPGGRGQIPAKGLLTAGLDRFLPPVPVDDRRADRSDRPRRSTRQRRRARRMTAACRPAGGFETAIPGGAPTTAARASTVERPTSVRPLMTSEPRLLPAVASREWRLSRTRRVAWPSAFTWTTQAPDKLAAPQALTAARQRTFLDEDRRPWAK